MSNPYFWFAVAVATITLGRVLYEMSNDSMGLFQ